MKLYEIDAAILALVNEDGEIADYEAFESLQMERAEKIDNVACWYKDLLGDASKIKAEEARLADRRKSIESKAERIKAYLERATGGEKFATARSSISYRKSESVEIEEGAKLPADLMTYKDPTPDKVAIKAAIKSGRAVAGCAIVEKQNIQIK